MVSHLKKSDRLEKSLISKNIPHFISYTRNSKFIEFTDSKKGNLKFIVSDEKLSFQDLGFMNKVKRSAIEQAEIYSHEKINITSSDIRYFFYNDSQIRQGIYFDVFELDLSGAYWHIARRLNYISEEVYKEGLTVNKKIRLKALGALATHKKKYEYIPAKKDYVFHSEKVNDLTRSFFFHVAHEIDFLMNEAIKGIEDSIYFYWVDAFFLKGKARKQIIEFFKNQGLEMSKQEFHCMEVQEEKFTKKIIFKKSEISKNGTLDIWIDKTFTSQRKEKAKEMNQEAIKEALQYAEMMELV